jgi:hypothetical protein
MKNNEVIQILLNNEKWHSVIEGIDFAELMHPEYFVLPAIQSDENNAIYIIFNTRNNYNNYLEMINSFIGPSYSTNYELLKAETANELESVLLKISLPENAIMRISILKENMADALDMLKKMIKLVQQSERQEKTYKQPLELLIRNYESAVLNDNFSRAEELLLKIKDNGELSYENVEFLRIKLLERRQSWEMIFHIGEQLLFYPRPALITHHILKSCFYVKLKQFAIEENIEDAAVIYKNAFDNDRFRGLFQHRYHFKDPEILILFALKEYISSKLTKGTLEQIESDFPSDGEYRPFFDKILEKIRSREKDFVDTSRIESAEILYSNGKIEDALNVLYMLTLSEKAIELLLEYTLDLNIKEYYILTQEKLSECDEELRGKVLQRRRNQKDWTSVFEVKIINGWDEWFEKIILDQSNAKKYKEIAENAQSEWDIEKYLNSENIINDIAILVSLHKDNYIFKQSFPYFLDYFFSDKKCYREFKPIYLSILEVIASIKNISDLPIFESMVEALLEMIVDQREYDVILNYIEDTWISLESERSFPWLLDIVNILEIYPCYNTKKKEEIFNYMIGFAELKNHRLQPDHLEIIGLLCADYKYPISQMSWWKHIEITTEEDDEKISKGFLQKKTIAIYSLFVPVLIKVKSHLESKYPGIDVRINYDKEETDSLKYLAKSADIFLFAWNAAKHQAYYCVKKYIDKDKLLMVSGKGSNSIIRSLNEYILKCAK